MQKKAYLALFLVFALLAGAWSVSPAKSARAQFAPEAGTAACKTGADALVGRLAELPKVQDRARQVCNFNVSMSALNSNMSDLDKAFIEESIAGNMLEIQLLGFALGQVQDAELQGLMQMMIAHHTHDLEMALEAADRLGLETEPDLTDVRVYPGTPEYDLGLRRVNLIAKFLDPLTGGAGMATPTPFATITATNMVTASPTGVVTAIPIGTPTGTVTLVPPGSPTGTVTTVPIFTPTGTATAIPIFTPTGTGTATIVPPGTPTSTPVTGNPDFEMLALHIIEEAHAMHVQTALAAQRLVKNDEVKAFAKHAADVAGLHLILLNDLKHRLLDLYTPPEPDFEQPYQGPRQFEPARD